MQRKQLAEHAAEAVLGQMIEAQEREMSVRSAPMVDGRVSDEERTRIAQQVPTRSASPRVTSGKASAIVTTAQLARGRTVFERAVGFGLLIGSFAGSVLAFNGGVFWPLSVAALLAGIGVQALLTVVQWFYRPHVSAGLSRHARIMAWVRALTWQYAASVIVGVGLSAAGYRTILYPPLFRITTGVERLHFTVMDVSGAAVVAWLVLIVVSSVLEVIPENVLID